MKSLIFALSFLTAFVDAQNDPTCGTKGPKAEAVNSGPLGIVGGDEAVPHEFPFVASIGESLSDSVTGQPAYNPHCTASIISQQWLLTAANCLDVIKNFGLPRAIVAAHNISIYALGDSEAHKMMVPVEKIIIHPEFDLCPENDIGLVKLAQKLDVSSNPDLGIICVPPQDENPDAYLGKLGTVVGWGDHEFSYERLIYSNVLRKMVVPVISLDSCDESYGMNAVEKKTNICTYQEGKGICTSDFGGPLMLQIDGRWTVIGVSSYATYCADGYPDRFTHVSVFSEWIWKTIKENS